MTSKDRSNEMTLNKLKGQDDSQRARLSKTRLGMQDNKKTPDTLGSSTTFKDIAKEMTLNNLEGQDDSLKDTTSKNNKEHLR